MRDVDEVIAQYTHEFSEYLEMFPEEEKPWRLLRLLAKVVILREELLEHMIRKEKARILDDTRKHRMVNGQT